MNWSLELPRITDNVDDRLELGIDLMQAGKSRPAQDIFRRLMVEYIEHLDAYHHLALSFHREGKTKNALFLWIEAMNLALKFFPDDFDYQTQRLPWTNLENRPFLRLLYGVGFALMKDGQTPEAIAILERTLTFDPNDHQGGRTILLGCYLELNLPKDVLKLCQRYQRDKTEELIFGKVLALFQTGEVNLAWKALNAANERYPLIAAELVKEKHRRPRGMKEDGIRVGGTDQAYLYWRDHGKHWQKTVGAMEWLTEMLDAER